MVFRSVVLALSVLAFSPLAMAGDEDVREEKPKVEAPVPGDQALPEAPDTPDAALGEEPAAPAPEFGAGPVKPAPKKNPRWPYDPDRNIDYSEIMGIVDTADPGRGVLPPAQGFRGYRPNMVAVEAGDRTPGYGVLVEYSWNRLGIGGFYSFRNLSDADLYSEAQSFLGLYGIYRWLPWDFSPYILAGLEGAKATRESFGGLVGIGVEGRIYYGATLLLGYTYHSTAQKGFFGGGIGWSF
jgi:hypothetical protein